MIKKIIIWICGSAIISPVIILIISASVLSVFGAVVYATILFLSLRPFGDFWEKWFRINSEISERFFIEK